MGRYWRDCRLVAVGIVEGRWVMSNACSIGWRVSRIFCRGVAHITCIQLFSRSLFRVLSFGPVFERLGWFRVYAQP